MGADAAMAPSSKCGYLSRIQAASMPPAARKKKEKKRKKPHSLEIS
jgi:hypothetical protein